MISIVLFIYVGVLLYLICATARYIVEKLFLYLGEDHQTEIRHLYDPCRQTFRRNGIDVFILTTDEDLGELVYIHIWHDNSGGDWYLWSVELHITL